MTYSIDLTASEIVGIMDNLASLECNLDGKEFKNIFGEKMGAHLWQKFRKDFNLVGLWTVLDLENRRTLASYLKGFLRGSDTTNK